MRNVKQVSRFHNVGQGQFYSAIFKFKNKDYFRYVIDCGAEKKYNSFLHKEIDDYLSTFSKNGKLNILVISHLHFDHVSGLKKLIEGLNERKITIENIFLPNIHEMRRALLLRKWKSKVGNKENRWYIEFLLDPINFFVQYPVIEKIFLVQESDEEREEGFVNREILNTDFVVSGVELGREIKDTVTVINIKNCKCVLFHEFEFDFWTKEWDRYLLEEFQKEVSEILEENKLREIMSSDSELLKNIYMKLSKDLNETSLCLSITRTHEGSCIGNFYDEGFILSEDQIINYKKVDTTNFYSNYNYEWPENYYAKTSNNKDKLEKFGYMFTGDISLQKDVNYLNDFIDHFSGKSNDIGIFVVPHHGSRKNWDKKLLSYFNNPLCIVSAGIENNYGHPDFSVINDIINVSACIWVNNEKGFNHGFHLGM